ncbi:hypothetical protein V501_00730, partial [Pseudogymnoascus sp. VKM F-4519 (FW-2642)]
MDSDIAKTLLSDLTKKIELENKGTRSSKGEIKTLETKILENWKNLYNFIQSDDPTSLAGVTLEEFCVSSETEIREELAKKQTAADEAAAAKRLKAKAARDAKKAEKLATEKGPEDQQSIAGPKETEDQQSNAGSQGPEDQQSNAGSQKDKPIRSRENKDIDDFVERLQGGRR